MVSDVKSALISNVFFSPVGKVSSVSGLYIFDKFLKSLSLFLHLLFIISSPTHFLLFFQDSNDRNVGFFIVFLQFPEALFIVFSLFSLFCLDWEMSTIPHHIQWFFLLSSSFFSLAHPVIILSYPSAKARISYFSLYFSPPLSVAVDFL